ncbi:MAG TPA: hypothetical protein VG164_09200 [Trebonia sp.]|jgi:hypothetical protein|nr:hypothetical protein [Trebonia sp.]
MPSHFHWTTFDVSADLPPGWQKDVRDVAANADFREFPRTPVLSRERADVSHISRGRVHAAEVRRELPWLYEAYHTAFLRLAGQIGGSEPVTTAADDRYGVVLNVQHGTDMRFECHVDSNPLTGLLFCTDHEAGGGELVFGNDTEATDVAGVERSCSVIRAHAGHIVFFDARTQPHYARSLLSAGAMRVVAVMNFYTKSCPESTRPAELTSHQHRIYGNAMVPRRPRPIRVDA